MPTPARRLAVTLAAVSALVASTALPAAALDVTTTSRERVLGDLQHEKIHVRFTDGATARGDVLRFQEGDQNLELRPRLAQRRVHGLERFTQMAQRDLGEGAVAGTNGGYWISRRSGNPNGLHVQDGRLTSTNASADGGGRRNRSALGIQQSGRLLLDQVETEMTFNLPSGKRVDVDYMNRRHLPEQSRADVIAYDDQFGDSIFVPAGGVYVRTEGLRARSGSGTTGTVTGILSPAEDRWFTLESGQSALVSHRSSPDRDDLADLRVGDAISMSIRVSATSGAGDWPSNLAGALPAGGTLLRGGQIPSLTEWYGEAFRTGHFSGRQPRTAIGRTSGGQVLLVTVDGRRSGWSVGMTGRELARTMADLGARDAVNLDGGGSTTMTKGGQVVNRPSETGRSVASGLFLYTQTPPAPRNLDSACPSGQAPSGGFADTAGSVHGPAVDCLAWWGVTQGTSATTFSPANSVTRAQMASFLARFLDNASQRGDANGLSSQGGTTFRDVDAASEHGQAISRLADAGIVEGRADGTYRPADPVSRAQMATFIRRAVEHATGSNLPRGRDTFIDDNGSVHEASIDRLANIGVASGVGGFDYRPGADVRRDAMASLVMRGADFLVTEGRTTPPS